MIIAQGVEKRFGSRAVLRGVDLEVQAGAVTLLVGSNGAGKTTLLRVFTGLCTPDRGSVRVAGFDMRRERARVLDSLAFLPQVPRFHPRLTVAQVARYYARIRGRSDEDVARELESWGLAEHLTSTTAQLSGGLRQRLAIAIFALSRAPVLMLDEPGLSLDPEWRLRLQTYLSSEAQRGATVLVATHLLAEWENRGDTCVLLEDGRAGRRLPPERLRESYPLAEHMPTP